MTLLKNLLSSVAGRRGSPQAARGATTIVTTLHEQGFAEYGKAFLESFDTLWPDNCTLVVYAEGFSFAPPSSRIKVLDLHATIPALAEFKRRHASVPIAHGTLPDGEYNYRFNAVRFANKSYVMCDAARRCDSRYLLWLDADTRTFQHVPPALAQAVLRDSEFMAYLGRPGSHTETGFLLFDLEHGVCGDFFATLQGLYETDTLFTLREWHDCEAIDVCRAAFSAQRRMTARNLNTAGYVHPFINSVVGLFMDHMKGPDRKRAGQSSVSDYKIPPPSRVVFNRGRYSQIRPLMLELLPETIVEVGTWSGWRGVQMALPSLAAGKAVHYRGFDVFENATAEFDAREKNVKPHFPMQAVENLLGLVAELYPRFSFELVQGNTNETLKDERADFVFLDGGHAVATIRSDFEAVKRSPVVLLDDYYDGGIDTTHFGCNAVIAGLPHQVMPIKDRVAGGGTTQFALVRGS